MTIEQWIAVLSLFVSVVSLITAIISLHRTTVYERFDYATRLDIIDEIVQIGTPTGSQVQIANMGSGVDENKDIPSLIRGLAGFGYRASIKNKGSKSIPIHMIYMDYGAKYDTSKRVRFVLEGRFNLSPEEARQINFSLPLEEIEKTKSNFEIRQFLFWLRVIYENAAGKRLELIRPLGGYDGRIVSFVVSAGDSLA